MASSVEINRGLKSLVYFKLTVVLAILLLEMSCATKTKLRPTDSLHLKAPGMAPSSSDSRTTEKRLRDEYTWWKPTKHRMGGTDRTGADCSGFVRTVYKRVFNIDLPRTTKEQVRKGNPVKRYELQSGDLVFFQPPSYPRHVGIYLSRNEFVHVSKTKGVIISRIAPHYWGKYYWTARRILPQH